MDKILMNNMRFYGYHGVMPEEKKLGQPFILDAELYLPLQEAGQRDELSATVDYGAVYQVIHDIVTGEDFNLIEALAEYICAQILGQFPLVEKIILTVKKPRAPIDGAFDYIGVTLERKRS